jgi:hypothetical protein
MVENPSDWLTADKPSFIQSTCISMFELGGELGPPPTCRARIGKGMRGKL